MSVNGLIAVWAHGVVPMHLAIAERADHALVVSRVAKVMSFTMDTRLLHSLLVALENDL